MTEKVEKTAKRTWFLQHCAFSLMFRLQTHNTIHCTHTLKSSFETYKNALKICILINSYGYKLALDSNKTPFVSGKGVQDYRGGSGPKSISAFPKMMKTIKNLGCAQKQGLSKLSKN